MANIPRSTGGHTPRRSNGDWSNSTSFFTNPSSSSNNDLSTAFSRTRLSSSSFAVTSVGIPSTTTIHTFPTQSARTAAAATISNSHRSSTDNDNDNDNDDDYTEDEHDDGSHNSTPLSSSANRRPGLGAKQFSEDDLNLDSSSSMEQGQTRRKSNNKLRIAQRETRQLVWLRGMTVLLFALAASLVGVFVHQSMTASQDDQWQVVYEQQATLLIQQWEDRLGPELLVGLEDWQYWYYTTDNNNGDFLATATTTTTPATPSNGPTITNNFVERADTWRQATQLAWWGMAPLISSTNRTDWERYSRLMANEWMDNPALMPTEIQPPISPNDMLAPLWQHSPVLQSEWINQDLLRSPSLLPQEIFLSALMNDDLPSIVLGKFIPHTTSNNNDDDDDEKPWTASSHSTEDTTTKLQSMMYFPIPSSSSNNDNTADEAEATGILLALIDWDLFLQVSTWDAQLSKGVVVLLSNTCEGTVEQYAYQVVLEQPQEQSTTTTTTTTTDNSNNDPVPRLKRLNSVPSSHTLLMDLAYPLDIIETLSQVPLSITTTNGIQVRTDYCQYVLEVVPTQQMKEEQLQEYYPAPAYYTGGIVGVVLFCGLVFLAYDCLVERRQKKVMKSAVKTHEIVAGLFPETVRNRLFGDSMAYPSKDPRAQQITNQVHNSMRNGEYDDDDDDDSLEDNANQKNSSKKNKKHKKKNKKKNKIASTGSDEEILSPRKPDILGRGGALTASERTTYASRPIADLFPHTSVMFADIAGFTAWSSARDPAQVFTLLETIYAAFDRVAEQRSVFKVETIGDCYVAVTGLPQPQEDHALIMVKFARDCVKTMQTLVQSLEVELGPDTGDLSIRVGIHSGPVTAGVLRGQKSRFQLFGDTVNFASRMESNGLPNQIQCSQQTVDLLISANKDHWIHPRKEMVHAKGKGLVQTYWVIGTKPSSHVSTKSLVGASNPTMTSTSTSIMDNGDDHSDITEEPLDNIHTSMGAYGQSTDKEELVDPLDVSPHLQRLIDWNVDMLAKIIKTILATRYARRSMDLDAASRLLMSDSATSGPPPTLIINANPRNEYCEAIHLPHYDPGRTVKRGSMGGGSAELDEAVKHQLRDYITTIACAYNDHPFHNFEHASHVTMSANKLLKRVVNAEHVKCRRSSLDNLASKLHDNSYGITSDPLTHFACLFSALIHDVDHPGISNAQMLKEGHPLAEVYDGKSIAEQNSFDFAWELLMDSEFDVLRRCLFENEKDLERFRQLVINSIMATDVFDPDLVKIRNKRWRKAFPESVPTNNDTGDDDNQNSDAPPTTTTDTDKIDLKATVVIEHIIQAADVAHTMQHWHVYQKWNRRLFAEMHASYCAGKSPTHPADTWYKGELWFYDNYVVPLASKLRECRVFGASSDEFLTYAMDNRSEWETKGEAIVQDMVAACTHQSEEFLLTQIAKETAQERRKSQTRTATTE